MSAEFKDLNDFTYKEVLGGDSTRKSLFVLLEKGEEKAVFLCNKQAFEEDDNQIHKWIKSAKLNLLAKNDKYGNYEMALDPEFDFKFYLLKRGLFDAKSPWCGGSVWVLKSTLIYPANDFDIQKYRRQEAFIIYETPDDYKNITCQYLLETKQFENLKWVYNFLDKKSEEERIIFENPDKQTGFILAPDLKWNGTNLDELYLLAVAHRRDLHSIRDLTPNELPLLENIRDECVKIIEEKYGLKKAQLKMYFHYQPTFYHLHVHIVHIKYEAPGLGCTSVMLDTVIDNLKIFPDFYSKATLPFIRKEGDLLYQKFKESGRV